MLQGILTRLFGSRNQRLLKQVQQTVVRINALESALSALSDEALAQLDEMPRPEPHMMHPAHPALGIQGE